jgi:hypothetical protein
MSAGVDHVSPLWTLFYENLLPERADPQTAEVVV